MNRVGLMSVDPCYDACDAEQAVVPRNAEGDRQRLTCCGQGSGLHIGAFNGNVENQTVSFVVGADHTTATYERNAESAGRF